MAEASLYQDELTADDTEMFGDDFAVDYSGTAEDLFGSACSCESQELGDSHELGNANTCLSQEVDQLNMDSSDSQEQEADTEGMRGRETQEQRELSELRDFLQGFVDYYDGDSDYGSEKEAAEHILSDERLRDF